MATSGKGTGVVGYNVQTVVDAQHHLIVAHEVTNVGNDRGQLASMAQQAQTATGRKDLEIVADRGYFKGEEILACQSAGMTPLVPKPLTSSSKAEGRFGKQDFVYLAGDDTYRCPAGERLTSRYASVEDGMTLHVFWTSACPNCPLKAKCTTGKERRIKRWEHEGVLEAMQQTARSSTRKNGCPTADGRASVRNHQGLDGIDPFSHEDAAPGEHGDEPARPCLQSEADDEGAGGSCR